MMIAVLFFIILGMSSLSNSPFFDLHPVPLSISCNRLAKQSLMDFEDEISYTDEEAICSRKLDLAKAMIDGLALAEDDDAQLLALRQRFDD